MQVNLDNQNLLRLAKTAWIITENLGKIQKINTKEPQFKAIEKSLISKNSGQLRFE